MGNKGKKKSFVENKDEEIDLARSVADAQEQKIKEKLEAHHYKASAHKSAPSDQKRKDTSKSRLERAKAAVAAQAKQARREKVKLRKKAKVSADDAPKSQTGSAEKPQTRTGGVQVAKKRVTFG
ncbi:hypothetical protein PYCCODRAFT_1435834 [Trametes coccinea BRFM310]|uniref:Uncharacterized protein n=1 Tax=Trametes coccinea (strain BRFM310) TaxID=1353009 RepID=A0A1Y2ILZ8_TRAC3|nr:hypothetical protein PYCCODRAFT_1435834 [Trametes coccinea BRFM310]